MELDWGRSWELPDLVILAKINVHRSTYNSVSVGLLTKSFSVQFGPTSPEELVICLDLRL